MEDFAHRPEYVYGYQYGHAYHGSHPFFMWNSTTIPRRYLSRIFFAGVQDPEAAQRCGFEAVEAARSDLGVEASITMLQRPPQFIPRMSAH